MADTSNNEPVDPDEPDTPTSVPEPPAIEAPDPVDAPAVDAPTEDIPPAQFGEPVHDPVDTAAYPPRSDEEARGETEVVDIHTEEGQAARLEGSDYTADSNHEPGYQAPVYEEPAEGSEPAKESAEEPVGEP